MKPGHLQALRKLPKITMLRRFLYILLILISVSLSNAALAVVHQTGLWLGFFATGNLFHSKNIKYLFNPELRFVDHKNRFEIALLQAGLGYQLLENFSLWGGYQWLSKNQIFNTNPENRLWQQMIWNIFNNETISFTNRTRLEETSRVGEAQWANRLRERFILRFPNAFFQKYTPVIYDETFFNLSKPHWVSPKTFSQNRLFVGLDIPTSKNTFIEAGYLNQYLFRRRENAMNNVIYITFYVNT